MPDLLSTTGVPATAGEARTSTLTREGELEFVLEFISKSDRIRSQFTERWNECLDNYLVIPYGDNRLGRFPRSELGRADRQSSRLADPETHQIVETLASQAIDLILGQKDYITAVPKASDDPMKAEMIAKIIQAILELEDVYDTHWTLIKDAFIFGTAIVEVGWESRTRVQVEGGVPVETLYKDQPLIKQVDIYDFYPDPSGTRIHGNMLGVAKRFRITEHQARQLGRAGVYNMEKVNRAIQGTKSDKPKPRDSYIAGGDRFPDLPKETPSQFGMLRGFEYWGTVPLGYGSGMENRVITVLEGEIVRSTVNPYMDGNIPFREYVINPVQGRFYGLGPAEVVRFLQDSTNNILMTFNDAVNLMVQPGWLIGRAFGGDVNKLRRPGFMEMIECRDVTQVAPIPRDFKTIEVAAGRYMQGKMTMREATGATDILQAIEGGDRQTATEISTLTKSASQKVVMTAALIERGPLPWEGRAIHSRLRQFGNRDGFTATLYGKELDIPFEAINADADIRFGGSRQLQNKFQEVVALRELLNIVGVHAMQLDVVAPLVEEIAEKMEIVGGREKVQAMVQASVQKQQMMLQMQMMEAQKKQGGGNTPRAREENSGSESGETEKQGQAIQ